MQSIYNFRDAGGYTTQDGRTIKKGLLYRSGSLANASRADLQELSSLGIRTICDLRTIKERSRRPDPVVGARSLHIPIKVQGHNESGALSRLFSVLFGEARTQDYDELTLEMYREYASDFRAEFAQALHIAADGSNLPLLIHCTAGKDRTGFACSLIHHILGLAPETVMQDYLLTNDYMDRFREETLRRLKPFTFLGISTRRFLPLFQARREFLQAAYDQIRNDYAALEEYVRVGLDFSDEDRRRLQGLFLA